ncbi:hypothetical protein HMF8227_00739 [Saliniradius amylolyticus]|uniref:DUF2304 domain-containing protein n=1 Tax=Saliniradius amylolyticus TaxID=2183582 RepID=A0A2S2E0Q7_9ALTE|nr:DUF2304 domain-containing protein [Saliniradius amylolyticus]AWL11235.1 hypothetical protein HMF8227_00739 [Saliniradius amylolyticus]
MSTPQIVSSIIAALISITIIWMVRRDHLITRDGLKWILISIAILLYGFFPQLNDIIGSGLGISYPPIIPVLLGMGVILIKLLIADIERARMQVTINRLVQRLAMLEADRKDSSRES